MRVRVSAEARRDLRRLFTYLGGRNESAANRALDTLEAAIQSLAQMPDRARRGPGSLRELIVPFGSAGYIVQFRRGGATVVVVRIFHSLEDRPLA
ncbi:MAG: type II toxin-antitoxin system RelE/ParE family toxin [Caulobacterales bacterium]|nr:type II toxin-antitoxin system RelE/ParE family toxin [Caulobacterales bacterium]